MQILPNFLPSGLKTFQDYKMLITHFLRALSIMFKDKLILFLSTIPLCIGMVLYFLMGAKLYQFVIIGGQEKVKGFVGEGVQGHIAASILFILFMGILFFALNWTFVMVVSILASPFNDAISSLVEKRYTASNTTEENFSWRRLFQYFFKTIWNEIKKTSLIMILTFVALALSFFPIIMPLCFLISGLLLAIQFVDYSWSRHQWKVGRCAKDAVQNIFSYTFSGAFFLFIMAFPIVNFLAITLAVIHFTLLWADKNPKEDGQDFQSVELSPSE